MNSIYRINNKSSDIQLHQYLIIFNINLIMFDQLVSHIIRPNRDLYRIGKLGPKNFTLKSKINNQLIEINREDSIILNKYNKKIHMSFYEIRNQKQQQSINPCIIYLHANNGSRNQGLTYLKPLLQNQFNVVLFDCTGSGLSDGDYVTLGLLESQDLEYVIKYITQNKKAKQIGLWGRSMGAVTALLYNNRFNKKIRACVYDSPFYSLPKLIKQLANLKTGLPKFIFRPLISIIQKQIKLRTNVSISDLKLKKWIGNIQSAGFFLTSKNDRLVNCEHSQKIFQKYKGKKIIQYIENQHHQNRSNETIFKCIEFLKNNFSKFSHKVNQVQQYLFTQTPKKKGFMQKTTDKKLYTDYNEQTQQTRVTQSNYLGGYSDKTQQTLRKTVKVQGSQKISLSSLKKNKLGNQATDRQLINNNYINQKQQYRRTVTCGEQLKNRLIGSKILQNKLEMSTNSLNTKLSMFFDQNYKGIRRLQVRK